MNNLFFYLVQIVEFEQEIMSFPASIFIWIRKKLCYSYIQMVQDSSLEEDSGKTFRTSSKC